MKVYVSGSITGTDDFMGGKHEQRNWIKED